MGKKWKCRMGRAPDCSHTSLTLTLLPTHAYALTFQFTSTHIHTYIIPLPLKYLYSYLYLYTIFIPVFVCIFRHVFILKSTPVFVRVASMVVLISTLLIGTGAFDCTWDCTCNQF